MAATSPVILKEQGRGVGTSSGAGHVAALTGLRALAALVVVVVHGSGQTAYPEIGIHGFGPIALFVLSGYLLITPWSRWALGVGGRPDLSSFARRRVMRIFPAYLVVLFVVALVYPASRPVDSTGWLLAVTLTNTVDPQGLRPAMHHIWSLCTELSWYVALPLVGGALAALARRLLPSRPLMPMVVILLVAAAISTGWVVWTHTAITDLSGLLTYPMWVPGFILVFAIGAAVRHLELWFATRDSQRMGPERGGSATGVVLGLVVGTATVILLSDLSGPKTYVPLTLTEHSVRQVGNVALAVGLLAMVVFRSQGVVTRMLRTRPMVAIGRWSYGIYLWHLPLMAVLVEHMGVPQGADGFVIWIALLAALSTALGAVTYGAVERPAIAWSKRSRARNGA